MSMGALGRFPLVTSYWYAMQLSWPPVTRSRDVGNNAIHNLAGAGSLVYLIQQVCEDGKSLIHKFSVPSIPFPLIPSTKQDCLDIYKPCWYVSCVS